MMSPNLLILAQFVLDELKERQTETAAGAGESVLCQTDEGDSSTALKPVYLKTVIVDKQRHVQCLSSETWSFVETSVCSDPSSD